jgi:hypothetical protein
MSRLWLLSGFVVLSILFKIDTAEASYLLEKRCMASQTSKKSMARKKKICFCIVTNLESRLNREQTQALEKIYQDRKSRVTASKDEKLKFILNLDYEVNKNCRLNPQWRMPTEDLGTPDPL